MGVVQCSTNAATLYSVSLYGCRALLLACSVGLYGAVTTAPVLDCLGTAPTTHCLQLQSKVGYKPNTLFVCSKFTFYLALEEFWHLISLALVGLQPLPIFIRKA